MKPCNEYPYLSPIELSHYIFPSNVRVMDISRNIFGAVITPFIASSSSYSHSLSSALENSSLISAILSSVKYLFAKGWFIEIAINVAP